MADLSTTAYYAAEALAAHAAMDKVGVPRQIEDEKLSLAQRVEVMADALQGATNALTDCAARKEVS